MEGKTPSHTTINSENLDTNGDAALQRALRLHRQLSIDLPMPQAAEIALRRAQRILDVGCGSGTWVIEKAQQLPLASVVGIDINAMHIDAARAYAQSVNALNAMLVLDDMRFFETPVFQGWRFDFVNVSFIGGIPHMPYYQVAKKLYELASPNGFVCWREAEFPVTTSVSLEALTLLGCQAMDRLDMHCEPVALAPGGLSLAPSHHSLGMVCRLHRWLLDAGFKDLEAIPHCIDISANSPANQIFREQLEIWLKDFQVLLVALGNVGDLQYIQDVATQALADAASPGFGGTLFTLTVYGCKR